MTIASKRREASIVHVQRTHGSGETRKIHSVNQRLGRVEEDEAMKLRGIEVPMQSTSMSVKEPVERGEGDEGDHQTNDAVGDRTVRGQPAHHPKGGKQTPKGGGVTASSPMRKQCADNWGGVATE